MKRIIKLGILSVLLFTLSVQALNYKTRDLITKNIEATVTGDDFRYKSFSYQEKNQTVSFTIKNEMTEELPVSISVGFFNAKEKNVGTIYYCDETKTLPKGEETEITIKVNPEDLEGKKIQYVSVLSENKGCYNTFSKEDVGKTIKQIFTTKEDIITNDVTLFVKVLGIVGAILLIWLVYRFAFTNSFENFDGNDIRRGYRNLERKRKKERQKEEKKKKEMELELVPERTKEEKIYEQEQEAKIEDKSGTDLHNLYK